MTLTGTDGNAYAILAACKKAAREAGWPQQKINDVLVEMMTGDYDHLLRVAARFFDVR